LAAQRPLEPLILVRVQAPQLPFCRPMKSRTEYDPPENASIKLFSEPGQHDMSRSLFYYLYNYYYVEDKTKDFK
jgi:hypothetical protein